MSNPISPTFQSSTTSGVPFDTTWSSNVSFRMRLALKRFVFAAVLGISLSAFQSAVAQTDTAAEPAIEAQAQTETQAPTLAVGDMAIDFTLAGLDENDDTKVTLSHYQSGKTPDGSKIPKAGKNVVLVFVRAHW